MRGWIKPALFFAVLGLATYAVSLVASAPARLIASRTSLPSQIVDVSGTLWNGLVILRGDYELRWSVQPLRSLLELSMVADWTLSGADTAVSGSVSVWPASATASNVQGRAGWGLVKMAAPQLMVSCDGTAAVQLSRIVLSNQDQGAVGTLRSGPTSCIDSSQTPQQEIDLPPLDADSKMDGAVWTVRVVEVSKPETSLVDITIKDRVFGITIQPEAAKLLKSLPTGGPITLEYPF